MRDRLRLACDTHGRLVFSSSCIQLLDGLSAALLDQAAYQLDDCMPGKTMLRGAL